MFAVFKKEINSFFSSLTGYIVISFFLLSNGLFLWIFSGENTTTNIFDIGYASLEPLFAIAPWVFLFLIPSITMRLLSDESKSGTMELLLTHPLSDFQIVGAKFLAAIVLIALSIIPTLTYFVTVYALGSPVGNIDSGAVWGSYLGLFLLASIYASIGLFASSIASNQIISFIIATLICFVFFNGFQQLGTFELLKPIEKILAMISINHHYESISRGIIDSRDIIYYLSTTALFLYFTKLSIIKRRK